MHSLIKHRSNKNKLQSPGQIWPYLSFLFRPFIRLHSDRGVPWTCFFKAFLQVQNLAEPGTRTDEEQTRGLTTKKQEEQAPAAGTNNPAGDNAERAAAVIKMAVRARSLELTGQQEPTIVSAV